MLLQVCRVFVSYFSFKAPPLCQEGVAFGRGRLIIIKFILPPSQPLASAPRPSNLRGTAFRLLLLL